MKIMNFNKILTIISVAGLALSSCESELTTDAQLDVNVATSENASFDGKTITVKAGTPVEFQFSGNPDYLTFFSGEIGKEYRYRERTEVDLEEVESSKLTLDIQTQYGNTDKMIFNIMVSETFPGLYTANFQADSVLVEQHDGWQTLISKDQIKNPGNSSDKTPNPQSFEIDMSPYLGKRIAFAVMYKYTEEITVAQTKVYLQNMKITNKLTNGSEPSLTATSFGFTPINMMNRHNLSDQKSMTSNRAYGTVTNNTAGIWNFVDMNNFFIHSSNANTVPKYSWLVSNLFVVNGCTPDAGTGLKNISQRLDSYTYTYATPGTYTATFVATNGNYKQESQVVREYTVVVTE